MHAVPRLTVNAAIVLVVCLAAAPASRAQEPPPLKVGEKAPGFTLKNLQGEPVSLGEQLDNGPVALVVLRGYPGYQCPICSAQVGSLLKQASAFDEAGATVVLVYPGPAEELDEYAQEFVGSKTFPENFRFLLDPDYKFTQHYGLRWDAPRETAYPSSFVINNKGVVEFAKVSRTHGGRASTDELLEAARKAAPAAN